MKKNYFFKFLFPLIIFSIISFSCSKSQNISDIIEPVNINSGITDSLIVSDMFYAENYQNLKLNEQENVVTKLNFDKTKIIITAPIDFEGVTLVSFNFNDKNYFIPVRVNKRQYLTFNFKTNKKYKNVFLFGSFNGWDRSNLEMINNNGSYSISIPLEPGRYQYKFFADGKELLDKSNPEKISNGMGSYNSVFTVENKSNNNSFLHILNSIDKSNSKIFSFYYSGDKINTKNVFALLNNTGLDDNTIKLNGNKIDITIDKNKLSGKNLLRAVVCENGQSSNIQNVTLFNGEPAGKNNKNFTWHDAIIYSALIDRFNDGDKSINKPVVHDSLFDKANYMGGDFQGIIDKFNSGYFDKLGITTLWISPVYDNTDEAFREYPSPHRWFSGYHGYWPIKPRSVEEKFGTLDKLKELVATAHNHNVKILLDIVAHHVHKDHPYFKEHRDWFGKLELPDGKLNIRIWDEQRLTTWFEPFMPSFDFLNSQKAIDVVSEDAIWWLNVSGADGLRQDAVKHIPNKFWQSFNRRLKKEIEIPENKTVFQMGETFGSYSLVKSYVNNGQLPAQFNFNLYDVAVPTFLNYDTSFEQLDKEIKKSLFIFGENNLMGNIMDSQDKDRFLAYADGDLTSSSNSIEAGWNNPPKVDYPESYKKLRLYMAYLLSIPGLPTIYYGDEIGMTGAADPDNRRMMRFDDQLNKLEKENFDKVTALIHLRKNHPALRYGDYFTLLADNNIFSYVRSDLNERILVALNKNQKLQDLILKIPEIYKSIQLTDLITDEKIDVENNKVQLKIDGLGYRIFSIH
ncbi:MAG: hypothetical protein CO128_01255 [Ignavibacteriales bacterium CG_4_9_14_3_um_filter_30_11]|nr:MAG: hypothetical protein CO128_01255 [Ignavibacteriales bacterium CG_4_9_14_3_um_filter_30_11]